MLLALPNLTVKYLGVCTQTGGTFPASMQGMMKNQVSLFSAQKLSRVAYQQAAAWAYSGPAPVMVSMPTRCCAKPV